MKPETDRRIDEIRKIKSMRDESRSVIQEQRVIIKGLDDQEEKLWQEIDAIEAGDPYQSDLRDEA